MKEKYEVNISNFLTNNYSSLKYIAEVFDKLKSKNVKVITIDDDEQISNSDYLRVIKYIKYAGLEVEFKNYGKDISKRDEILEFCDVVRLELDCISKSISRKLFDIPNMHELVMNNYNYIKSNHPDISIQIDTNFNEINLGYLPELKEYVDKLDIDKWNIIATSQIIDNGIYLDNEMYELIIEILSNSDLDDKINHVKSSETKIEVKKSNKPNKLPYMLLRTVC